VGQRRVGEDRLRELLDGVGFAGGHLGDHRHRLAERGPAFSEDFGRAVGGPCGRAHRPRRAAPPERGARRRMGCRIMAGSIEGDPP